MSSTSRNAFVPRIRKRASPYAAGVAMTSVSTTVPRPMIMLETKFCPCWANAAW